MSVNPSGPILHVDTLAQRNALNNVVDDGQLCYVSDEAKHYRWDGSTWDEFGSGGAGGGAPTDVDYLVGTASGDLSAEIVVGTSPGGELGGTWASPTVDATHAGSTHVTDHGALTGLSDDDHTQYAALAQSETVTGVYTFAPPSTGSAHNILVMEDGFSRRLRFLGEADEFRLMAGNSSMFRFKESGELALEASAMFLGSGYLFTGDPIFFLPLAATNLGLAVRGVASQSADLMQFQDSTAAILTAFDKDGKLVFGPSGAQDTNLYRSAANFLKTDDDFIIGGDKALHLTGKSAATVDVLYGAVTGDAAARFTLNADGKMEWGPGTGAVDTNLFRDSAALLKTEGNIKIGGTALSQGNLMLIDTDGTAGGYHRLDGYQGNLYVIGGNQALSESATFSGGIIFRVTSGGNEIDALKMTGVGKVELPVTGSNGGLLIGGDANLYRSAADVLKTDDSVVVVGTIKQNTTEDVISTGNASWIDLTDSGETSLHSHAGAGVTIGIEEGNVAVGDASVVDFGAGFDVTFAAGEADVAIDLGEVSTFTDHSARHEDGGADEISLTGLAGDSLAVTALRGVDFLVGTATGELSGEIVAGTAPGGELGGTWASPTVDATHSGSTHTAATTTHEAAADPHTGYVLESLAAAKGDIYGASADNTPAITTVGADGRFLIADSAQAAGLAWTDHTGAADPHTGYRLESADHTHASSGAQAGTIDHGALTGLTDDDHTQYLKESDVDAVTFTIGAFFETTTTLTTGVRPIWRAPFDCTVTAVRGYVDTGTTTVINAGTGAASGEDFCSSNITIDPADAWESGTVNQNQTVTSGETVSVEIVTAGTATALTIQIDLTRDLSP